MNENFIDRFIREGGASKFFNFNKKLGISLFMLILGIIIVTTGCTQMGSSETGGNEEISVDIVSEPEQLPQEEVTVGNDGEKAGMADDSSVVEVDLSEDNMVTVSLENTGRADPFLPVTERDDLSQSKSSQVGGVELMPPLESLGSGEEVKKILTTKVSGIMYDNYSPSAILNIDGVDYLVRSGDTISDCKVLSISKTIVTVQSGENVYKAGVGQLLTMDDLNQGNIANLENKFGGSNKRSY